jgi:histidinol-phosphate/aromatic aminotransferase/cobyric acid decarboxylase-like protein/choline kinase
MKVIILAAGYGKRMRPLTNQNHKTLLQISGRSVIQRIVDTLSEFDLTDITIVTGYREADVQAHLADSYPSLKFNYIHNKRYAETNNIYSMALALQQINIDQDILLIESDLIFDSSVLARIVQSPHENIALIDRYRSGMDGTVVTLDEDRHVITNVIPPHQQGANFDFSDKYKTLNIYKFSQKFCQDTFKNLLIHYANSVSDNCYYELILGVIIYMRAGTIFAEVVDSSEKWAEIDDPNDLKLAQFMFDQPFQKSILDSSFGGYWNYDVIDYCFIRNMYFPSSAVLSDLKNNLVNLIHNYGSKQTILDQKLATYLLCQPEKLVALNGASQSYPILEQYFAGKKALLPSPTFGEYTRVFPNHLSYGDRIGIDPSEILLKAKECQVVVFVNPNNPTGSLLLTRWIYDFAANHPHITVLIDESFIEFSDQVSILELLESAPLPNVVLLASLSKTLGVPGMRLGYIYSANPLFNAFVRSQIPVWNLNSVAEYFLEIILKYRNEIKDSFQSTKIDRERFSQILEDLSIVAKVYPSGANFLLVEMNCNSEARCLIIQSLLSKHQIYVKDVSERLGYDRSYLRLAVRKPEENMRLVSHLNQIGSEIDAALSIQSITAK